MRFNLFLVLAFCFSCVLAASKDYGGLFRRTEESSSHCLPPRRIKIGERWTVEFYTAADNRDPAYVDKYFGQNTSIYFANSPPTVGKEAIRRSLLWQYSASTSITHELEAIFVQEDLTIVQVVVTYNFTDGTQTKVKAYTTYAKTPEDIQPTDIRIYGDFTVAFAKFIEIAGPPPS